MRQAALVLVVLGTLAVRAWAQLPATVPTEPTRVIPPATDRADAALAQIDELIRAVRFEAAADVMAALLAEPTPQLASRGEWNYPDWGLLDARRVAERRLASWPIDATRAYQSKVGPEASLAIEQAGADATRLRQALDRFLFTDVAAAGRQLLDGDWRDGRFVEAARTARRLLLRPLHPTDRAQILVELAFAEAMGGRIEDAERTLARLRAECPGETVVLGARRLRVAELTTASLPKPPRFPVASTRCDGFGNERRNGLAVEVGVPTELAWRAKLPALPQVGKTERDRARLADWMKKLAAGGHTLVNAAVVVGDRLVINRGHELLAFDLGNGSTPASWKQAHPPDGVLRGMLPEATRWIERMGYSDVVAPFFAIAADERRVVAITGIQDNLPTDGANPPREQQRLWQLDVESGRVAWSHSSTQVLAGLVPEGCYFSGAIALVDDQLFATVRGPLQSPTQAAWLVCLSVDDGSVRWLTPLGSALLMGTRLAIPEFEECYVAHLAVADGRIFVASGVGSVAAVETATGRIAWLSGHPHRLFTPQRNANPHLLPFNSSPTIVSQGMVFSMPIDGGHLLVHDAETGEPRRLLSREQLGNPTVLLGVRDDRVLLTDEKNVFAVRWRDDDPRAPAPKPDWTVNVPARRGRPLLTGNRLYLPTVKGLLLIDLDSGKPTAEDVTPLLRSLPGGDVLLHGSQLLIVASDEVATYRLAEPARR